ncbi:MAG: hypothetical protein K2P84_10695 [Undibacterium sp.]|nr:hypothetical protein [Undibacterium sp.]
MTPEQFLQKAQTHILHAKGFEQAMAGARFLGELLWKNNIGCYQLIALEQQLLEKYSDLFTAPMVLPSEKKTDFLHVLTKAYDTGGHTRVVERFISSEGLKNSAVLVTEKVDPLTSQRLALAKNGLHVLPKQNTSLAKIKLILRQCALARTVILHIHPNDIETVFAVALAKLFFGTTVLLYNHADHVFSFGLGVADRVLELSYFGWALRAQRQSLQRSYFIGIPLKLTTLKTRATMTDKPYLASAGTAYKYQPSLGYSFPHFAKKICEKTAFPLFLIGPKPQQYWWWSSWLRSKGQIQFTGKMPYTTYLPFIEQASAYIDSFPMTGGTGFTEVLCLGVPCFGVLTGAHGYSPADQLKSATIEQLQEDLLQHLSGNSNAQEKMQKIFPEILAAHSLEHLAASVVEAAQNPLAQQDPPWHNPIAVDPHFYEKIWVTQKLFSLPVHSWPDLKIAFLFLRFWFSKKFFTNSQK